MKFTNVISMPFAFFHHLYFYILFFYTCILLYCIFLFFKAPFDASVLSCHIIAERDAGMMQIGEIERLIGNKLMTHEGIAHRQLTVHAFHHLEAVIATVFYHEESSRVPFYLHLFPQVECFCHKLTFYEESARRDGILSCHKRFPIGISHHTGEEIEVIYAWFAGCYYISPHTFQGTHGDGLVGVSLNLTGEELKILW